MTDPLQLFLVYMTPWRNPNSIFVYLLIILYALGKYSEAQSILVTLVGMMFRRYDSSNTTKRIYAAILYVCGIVVVVVVVVLRKISPYVFSGPVI
eukprot:scaffold1923_cov160-Amphora_coffeaeformis.AAC.2